jgi:hypothetical protein
MQHYWGRKAICQRLDIRSPQTLNRLIAFESFPCYPKVRRCANGRNQPVLYSNSELILAWELAKARQYAERQYGSRPLPKYLQKVCDRRTDLYPRDKGQSRAS